MTVKEYLKTNETINISAIAKLMYPTNKAAGSYLLRKLSDQGGRPFTKKDSERALIALKNMSAEISELTLD